MGREDDRGHRMLQRGRIPCHRCFLHCQAETPGLHPHTQTWCDKKLCGLGCYEISVVFPGPGGRAAGPGWDHNYSGSSGHMTHSTRHIVVMCALQRILVLCPIHMCIILHATSVSEGGAVFWGELWALLWHTQVIGSTSLLVVIGSSSDARVDQLSAVHLWARTVPPPGVDIAPPLWGPGGPGGPAGPCSPSFPGSPSLPGRPSLPLSISTNTLLPLLSDTFRLEDPAN